MTPKELIDGVAEMLEGCLSNSGRGRAEQLCGALEDLLSAARSCHTALGKARRGERAGGTVDRMRSYIDDAHTRFDTGDESDA